MSWQVRPIRLRYRLGPLTLLRLPLPFAVYDHHWSTIGGDGLSLRPPFATLPAEVAGGLVPGCPLPGAIPRVSLLPEAIRYTPYPAERYYVELSGPGGFEGYLGKFSSKTRSTLKKKLRRLQERTRFREFRGAGEMAEFHRLAREVARKTYQEKLLQAALPDEPEYLAEMERLAAADRGRGYLLELEGAPIAYLWCPVNEGAVLYEYLGYDPAHRELSAGTVLTYLALERLFAEGRYTVFDFTEGPGQHKELFSTHHLLTADVYYFKRGARGASVVASHAALASATRGGIALLERYKVRDRLRKYLRSRHASDLA
jgi:CelD/BcsL family acetyltransferase involved in cellulose biosynthesis